MTMVEPLYYGHPWDHIKCPDLRGVLISEVVFVHFSMYVGQKTVS